MGGMTLIDAPQALALLDQVVAKYGADTMYTDRDPNYDPSDFGPSGGCKYVNEQGEPLCIVGVALIEFGGVPASVFEGEANSKVISTVGRWNREIGDYLTHEAMNVLAVAQTAQDMSSSWGRALIEATEFEAMCAEFEAKRAERLAAVTA